MPDPAPKLSRRLQAYWFSPRKGGLSALERGAAWALEKLYRALLWVREGLWMPLARPTRSVAGVRTLAVGNLIVGGAGKTPTVMALSAAVRDLGLKAAILSRGYQSQAEHAGPVILTPADLASTTAQQVGDEAWLLCWRTQLPVAVGKNRHAALRALKEKFPEINFAILDDGLSQRQLSVDQSMLVMDSRAFGNRHCLPLGPLREPAINLKRFTAWVDNGFSQAGHASVELPALRVPLTQRNGPWVRVDQWQSADDWLGFEAGLAKFRAGKILAVAGIAVPERFFESLRDLGLSFDTLALADHDPQLVNHTLAHCESRVYDWILMTEKDAVKFFHEPIALRSKMWALRKEAHIDPSAIKRLLHGLKTA